MIHNSAIYKRSMPFLFSMFFALLFINQAFAEELCEVRLSKLQGNAEHPAIATSNNGSSYVVWQENRGDWEIILCKIDEKGNIDYDFGLVNVSETSTASQHPDIAIDANDNCYVIWRESDDIYFSIIDTHGVKVIDKLLVDSGSCSNPQISTTPAGTSHIVYEKTVITFFEVKYAQIDVNGIMENVDAAIVAKMDILGIIPKYPSIITDSAGYSYIFWRDYYNWSYGLYYTLLNPDGSFTGYDKYKVSGVDGEKVSKPKIALSNTNGYIYFQYDTGSYESVYTFYNGLNKIDSSSANAENPSAASDENDNVYISWQDNRNGNWDIYLSRLGVDRKRLGDEIRLTDDESDSQEPDIAVFNGVYYLVWQDNRDGEWQIYFVRKDLLHASSDIVGKVFCGYQGWFACEGDGSPIDMFASDNFWRHWSDGDTPSPGNQTFELYPDISEYQPSSLFQTNYSNFGNGNSARLFSSYSTDVITQHFKWMEEYGIDGIALQRFGSALYCDPSWLHCWSKEFGDSIALKVKDAAEQYNKLFVIIQRND